MTMTLERLDDSIVLFDLDRFPLKGARMLIDRSDTIGARLTLALSLSLSLSLRLCSDSDLVLSQDRYLFDLLLRQ